MKIEAKFRFLDPLPVKIMEGISEISEC